MAKKITHKTQKALGNKIFKALGKRKPVADMYKKWCANERKLNKTPKPPKAGRRK